MIDDYIFTSESVTAGHPDKLCDQVSDAIVDHFLVHDHASRVEAECAIASGILFISAHYASRESLDIPGIARRVMREVGYPSEVFKADDCTIMTNLKDHTADHPAMIDVAALDEVGLGKVTPHQQVTVFGYACDQTPALMPMPIWLAHRLAERMSSSKVVKKLPYLLPDGKAQVSIEYKNGTPERIHAINLVASQGDDSAVDIEQLRADLVKHVVKNVLKTESLGIDDRTLIFVNPEGLVIGGGPVAHSGQTGRKSIMDGYGGYARQNSTALSGKDPLSIERVATYAARYVAKNLVAADLARECEVQLSYTVGKAAPVSIQVRSDCSGRTNDKELSELVGNVFDLRVGALVRDLGLQELPGQKTKGFYQRLAAYGHVGRLDLELPWEQTDKVSKLK